MVPMSHCSEAETRNKKWSQTDVDGYRHSEVWIKAAVIGSSAEEFIQIGALNAEVKLVFSFGVFVTRFQAPRLVVEQDVSPKVIMSNGLYLWCFIKGEADSF